MGSIRAAVAGSALALGGALVAISSGCADDGEPPRDDPGEAGPPEASVPMADVATPPRVIGPAVECAIGSAIEEEPNDTPAKANAFTELSYCGVLETAKDVDYVTFTTPPNTTLGVFQAVIDGKVDFELMLNGATFGPADTDKFGAGTYVVKAFTTAGKPASYRIRVQFDPM